MLKKHWPHVKQYEDIKGLNYERLKADGLFPIDIITGGYPCQPFSVAGNQKGEQDPRHLWPEMFRLVQELRPSWVIGENVSGHIKLGLDTVLENLESEGYSARTFSISASSIGAKHKRERVWIVANTRRILRGEQSEQDQRGVGRGSSKTKKWSIDTNQISGSSERVKTVADTHDRLSHRTQDEIQARGHTSDSSSARGGEIVANSSSSRREIGLSTERHRKEGHAEKFDNESNRQRGWQREDNWAIEPDVGRVAHGVPKRVDRLKCLGNSLVPQIPYYIGKVILEVMNGKTN